ncbi:MAG: ATP-binding protein, partial [Elusimicrobia bacterium]|nr:ATP-binding protein [Elusimicrobiota bacterium]
PYRGIDRESESTWIATKSRDAFEDLWGELVAFKRRHFSARREIEVVNGGWLPRPRFDWSDLVLPAGMAEEIRRHAESFLAAREHYKALRLPYRRGFLFAGPPGVGKTFAVKVLYSKLRASAFALDLKSETKDGDLKRAFDAAAAAAPSVLLLEDLDRIVGGKEVSMSFLLNLLDGLEPKEGLLLVATTNAPEKLDQALLHRPSRFDRVWHFPLPGLPERLRLMEKRGQGRFSQAALQRAAERSAGFTMAYAQEAVVSALLAALFEKRTATDADLLASVDELAQQVREGHKKDGLLKADAPVGFAASSNGRERAAAE